MSTWTRGARNATGSPLTIGVLLPVVGGYYFGRILAGMTRVLRAEGHRVVAVQTYPADLDRDEFPVAPFRRAAPGVGAFDGLVVVTTALGEADLRRLGAAGVPLVGLGVSADGLDVPVVAPDNVGGVRAAVDHLVDHGHRRIGFLGNTGQSDIAERYDAFRDALAHHGLEHAPEQFYRTRDNQESSAELVARRLAEQGITTTATLAATDRNAVGFLRGLQLAGLEVPAVQAVVGFDNSDSGARTWPRLTSIDPMHDLVGERAAELVVARVRGQDVDGDHRLDVSALVTRESCGCARGTRSTVVVDGEAGPDEPDPLAAVARVVLARTDGVRRGASETWLSTVRQLVEACVVTGQHPPASALRALGDRTAALRPGAGALEQLVPALHAECRRVRGRLAARAAAPGADTAASSRPRGMEPEAADDVEEALSLVVAALARGCGHGDLARAGRLEQDLVDQNAVDLELMRSDGEALRRLDWMPRTRTSVAALALWEDDPDRPGERVLRVVGARGQHPGGEALVGQVMTADQFPPAALTDPRSLTVVVPVAFGRSDRGFLAVGGLVDTRATSTRARYNHWAAMLAVALDAEEALTSLRAQRRELAEAAERERALAVDVAAGEERAALVSIASHDGTWDWDVDAGTVRYSPAWAALVGTDRAALGDDPHEWFSRVHPDDLQRVHAAVAAQLSGSREPLDVEHRLRVAGGAWVPVRCRAVTVHDAGDRPARLVGAMARVADDAAGERGAGPGADLGGRTVPRELFVDRADRAIRRGRRVAGYGWQVLAVGFPAPPAARALDRLLGEIGEDDCVTRLGPRGVAVLLDGHDPASARRRAARVGAVLGAEVVVEPVGTGEPAGGLDAGVVLRRAEDVVRRGTALPVGRIALDV
ncbi:substrate-binding domain-containing protein [Isoptericola jiangsuensis]|uniref:substrate-binding domain-containing protein n=1 Tax=Isoptericola jiangsuensis TaxID=548579 RepID=UPI001472F025|nr:substrate-binding domain-containing protein [Isoptericola jiangsuensis]